jgi:hypothetical protein
MRKTSIFLAAASLFFFGFSAHAQELETIVSTDFAGAQIANGASLASSDSLMRVGIQPGTLAVDTRVDVKTLDPVIMDGTYASFSDLVGVPNVQRHLLGNVYLFDIVNKSTYANTPLSLQIGYDSNSVGIRHMYFWNGVTQMWHPLPSSDQLGDRAVRAIIQLPYARLAVFEDAVMSEGKASWYAYQGCDCAASPDYSKGTYLVVSRADDPERAVTVRVNDWGPDRSVFPDRVIDLDRVAFEKIGNPRGGVLDVVVQFLQ